MKAKIVLPIIGIVGMSAFFAYRAAQQPPIRSSFQTFMPDSRQARDQADRDPERFAMRLQAYAVDAFQGRPWEEVVAYARRHALIAPGDRTTERLELQSPKWQFSVPGLGTLDATIITRPQISSPPTRVSTFRCLVDDVKLTMKSLIPSRNVSSKHLPEGSILRTVLERSKVSDQFLSHEAVSYLEILSKRSPEVLYVTI